MKPIIPIKKILVIPALTCLLSAPVDAEGAKRSPAAVPEDFKSDGCSLFPDGDYRHCCVEHDKAYYLGGSWRRRLNADNHLFKCVAGKGGIHHKVVAPLMWVGVRMGGAGYIPIPMRWGFGKKTASGR